MSQGNRQGSRTVDLAGSVSSCIVFFAGSFRCRRSRRWLLLVSSVFGSFSFCGRCWSLKSLKKSVSCFFAFHSRIAGFPLTCRSHDCWHKFRAGVGFEVGVVDMMSNWIGYSWFAIKNTLGKHKVSYRGLEAITKEALI